MLFNRMIVKNEETPEDGRTFVYTATKKDDDAPPHHFLTAEIRLLDNGWVMVTRHDTGSECFPPSRVIALEIDPIIHAVSDRPSHG